MPRKHYFLTRQAAPGKANPYWALLFPLPDGTYFRSTLTFNSPSAEKRALAALTRLRDELTAQHYPDGLPWANNGRNLEHRNVRASSTGPVVGVYRHRVGTLHEGWTASCAGADGRKRQKTFSCNRWGSDQAFRMALQYRKIWQAEKRLVLAQRFKQRKAR